MFLPQHWWIHAPPPKKNIHFLGVEHICNLQPLHGNPSCREAPDPLVFHPSSLETSTRWTRWLRAPPLCPDKDSRFQGEVGCLLGALKFGDIQIYPAISRWLREARGDMGYFPETWFFTSIKQHTTYAVFLVHGKMLVKFVGVWLPGTTQYQRDYSYWRWGAPRTSGFEAWKGAAWKAESRWPPVGEHRIFFRCFKVLWIWQS